VDGDNLTSRYLGFWRRIILLAAVIIGSLLLFYKAPALLTASWVDFTQQKADEVKSPYKAIGNEGKRLQALSLETYIQEKTQGKIINLEADQWRNFYRDIYLVGTREIDKSKYADRISPRDIEILKWQTGRTGYFVPIFFKVQELPIQEWNLSPQEGAYVYLVISEKESAKYLRVEYHDYLSTSGPMTSVYPEPPAHLYYPYRNIGWGVLGIGILLAIFLPQPRKRENVIEYPRFRLVMGDILGVILLLLFFCLPFLINGGTVQAVQGWWGLSLIFWFLALGPILILYSSAAYAAFHVRLGEDSLHIARAGSGREYRYDDVERIERLELHNPAWFRKLFFWVLMFSFLSGKGASSSSVGTYFLSEAAAYTGLALYFKDGHIQYIWITDALGNVLLPDYENIVRVLQGHGVPYHVTDKVIEKFLPLP